MADNLAASVRRLSPIRAWGWFGGFIVLLQACILLAWMNSAYFKPLISGADPLPAAVLEALHKMELDTSITAIVLVLLIVIHCVLRRRLTSVALVTIAWLSCCWQDPLSSYFRPFLVYNAALFNYGTWSAFIPGYALPHGDLLPQPLLLLTLGYLATPVYAVIGAFFAGRAAKLLPNLGPVVPYITAWAVIASVDLLVESAKVKDGVYAFPSIFAPFSSDVGKTYQYPIYNSVMFGMAIAVSSLLLHYSDAKGRTPVEAGADDIANPLARTAMRLLAVAGITNAALLVYMVVMAGLSLFSSPIPHYPTYLLNPALCGQDVPYQCQE